MPVPGQFADPRARALMGPGPMMPGANTGIVPPHMRTGGGLPPTPVGPNVPVDQLPLPAEMGGPGPAEQPLPGMPPPGPPGPMGPRPPMQTGGPMPPTPMGNTGIVPPHMRTGGGLPPTPMGPPGMGPQPGMGGLGRLMRR